MQVQWELYHVYYPDSVVGQDEKLIRIMELRLLKCRAGDKNPEEIRWDNGVSIVVYTVPYNWPPETDQNNIHRFKSNIFATDIIISWDLFANWGWKS